MRITFDFHSFDELDPDRKSIDPSDIKNPHPYYAMVPPPLRATADDAGVHIELCVKSTIMFCSPPLGGVA